MDLGYNTSEMNEKRKKILKVLGYIALLSVLLVGIAVAFVVGYNPVIPNTVQVIDDGNSVYLYAETNDNYSSYRFRFENDEENIIINSRRNLLSCDEMLQSGIEIGKNYSVTVTYISSDDTFNSRQSRPLSWKAYTYLDAPYLYRDGDYIRWEYVENADFYEVHYNLNSEEKVVAVNYCYYALQNIEGGQRDVYVVAKSRDESYKESLKSNTLELEVVHHLANFENVEFDVQTLLLTMTSSERIDKMNIYVGEKQFQRENLNPTLIGEVYHYLVDLSAVFETEFSIGIAPASIDRYNIYSGEILYI